jgi:hypothetical protein
MFFIIHTDPSVHVNDMAINSKYIISTRCFKINTYMNMNMEKIVFIPNRTALLVKEKRTDNTMQTTQPVTTGATYIA